MQLDRIVHGIIRNHSLFKHAHYDSTLFQKAYSASKPGNDKKKPAENKSKLEAVNLGAKKKPAVGSKPAKVKPTSTKSTTGSQETMEKDFARPWITNTKSKEEAKPVKMKPLTTKSGSRESI